MFTQSLDTFHNFSPPYVIFWRESRPSFLIRLLSYKETSFDSCLDVLLPLPFIKGRIHWCGKGRQLSPSDNGSGKDERGLIYATADGKRVGIGKRRRWFIHSEWNHSLSEGMSRTNHLKRLFSSPWEPVRSKISYFTKPLRHSEISTRDEPEFSYFIQIWEEKENHQLCISFEFFRIRRRCYLPF